MTALDRRGSPSGPKTTQKFTVATAAGNAATATVTNITMTVTGLTVLSGVVAVPTAAPAAGLAVGQAFCATANVLTVPLVNPTAAQVAAGTMTFTVVQFEFKA